MTWPSRSKHCCPTSRTIQPSRRRRPYPVYSLTSFYYKYMRNSTNLISKPNSHPTTTRPNFSCGRQISPIWTPPVTPSSNRRPNPCIRPTSLQHNSSCWNFPTHPNSSPISQQPYRPLTMSMLRSPLHTICSHLRPNPK